MGILVSRTKSDLRISWDTGELPFNVGDRCHFHWDRLADGTHRLVLQAKDKGPVVRPYRDVPGRLEIAWTAGIEDIPCFGPVTGSAAGSVVMLPAVLPEFVRRAQYNRTVVKRQSRREPVHAPKTQEVSSLGSALEAIRVMNERMEYLVKEVNEAKAMLGSAAELSIKDGKLRFDFIMGFGG